MGYRRSQQTKNRLKNCSYKSNVVFNEDRGTNCVCYDYNYYRLKYGRKYYRKKFRNMEDTGAFTSMHRRANHTVNCG